MRVKRSLQKVPSTVASLSWLLGAFLGPSASLMVTTTGCGASRCQMSCTESSVCMTGGCFHDGKDKCEDYPSAAGWTTTWPLGSTIRCDELTDTVGNVIGVTCKGVDGKAVGESCTCNFAYTNGVKHCA